MHHLYPGKGDPLCPLGFHPQVRWPTRCKRCFRDYKEHGGKRREDDSSLRRDDRTSSTPSLSWNSRDSENDRRRNWVSITNLTSDRNDSNRSSTSSDDSDFSNPSSWTSTPDLANLEDDTQPITTVNVTLPTKRKIKSIDTGQRTVSDSFSVVKEKSTVFNRDDNLATRAKKLQAIKESHNTSERTKRIQIKEVKTISEEPTNHDVQFLIQVKRKSSPKKQESIEEEIDNVSLAGTETTDTTLVDVHDNELREQLDSLKKELDTTKAKCDRLEREKSDILLRRLAAMETTTSKTTATEVLKLRQKCNEMQQQLEDCKDEKRSLSLKVKELEEDIELRPTAQQAQKIADELRSKLLAAETLCEELMDENEDIKKELRDMEEQMEEMQDNFREDQADRYTSIKKELDQTTKNCRILSFKLRKAEKKVEQLETDKTDLEKKLKDVSGGATTLSHLDRIKHLEQELNVSNEVSKRLQRELEEANKKIEETKTPTPKKKAPLLGNIGKVPSGDGKVSRESLTRGGSQDDPAQLLRDLQDSLEREADLREQLKFAEEEAQNLRKKVSRVEDDNESLVLQLKKMATRARSRKLSPTNQRLTPEPPEKSEVSDDDDPAEIKLQLELSEHEVSVLRRKVEELELDNHRLKTKTKELQEKCSKTTARRSLLSGDKGGTMQNQKLKILEDETNDLRKKLIEKERDCERLHAELSLNQKRGKGIQKSKSLDMDQQTLDLKRQLQVIEQEAAVLRNKVQSLETENEKLTSENKRLSLLRGTKAKASEKNIDKYIDQIAKLEIELGEANEKLKTLESGGNSNQTKMTDLKGYKKFTQRTPKKVTSLTSREQLKNMVTDLENEIGEMLVAIKTSENSKIKLEEEMNNKAQIEKALKDLDEINKKYDTVQKELSDEKAKNKKFDDVNKTLTKTKESLDKAMDDKQKLKEELDKSAKEYQQILDAKKHLDEEISKLKTNLKNAAYKQDEITLLTQKTESLKLDLESKDKELNSIKKELAEKTKLVNDLTTKNKRLTELENKLTEYEDKYNKCDKKMKDQLKDFENNIDKEKQKNKSLENEQLKLEDDKKNLNLRIDDLGTKVKGLENSIEQKNKHIKQLEESLAKEREAVTKSNQKVGALESREINKLKDELSKKKVQLSELESKLELSVSAQKNLEDKLKKMETENKNNKLEIEKKNKELEIDLQNEKKKIEVLKGNQEKEHKNRELELTTLKNKIKKLELNSGGSKDDIKHFQENIEKLESTITKERQKYDDLTVKYEMLEEEHVVTKAKLVMEKETLDSQLLNLKKETNQLETELKTLRDTYNSKQDTWIKEKLEIQEKLKEKSNHNGNDFEKNRLKSSLEELQSELDQVKKEYNMIKDQLEFMRRENDELKRKLDDYERVNKVQRNISADSAANENEIRHLRIKLNHSEKNKKTELADCKIRFESQLSLVNKELQSLQNQVMRFKRERDNYKHMLEAAQKTIGDLRQSPKTVKDGASKSVHYDELEESRSKVANLEQQVSCMEDELSEARLECSRLKTELVSERSSWEVKLSEFQSKINELEEEKILNSGRTKIVGLRTRMELAWQKEREEQQRLLQETATLARDLRQTLFEVERERDKERLEAKRKQDQFKKSSEEEGDENKKKITELQCDLLELRDAHAKLRTTNEKLRREKERYEKEREEFKLIINGKKRSDQEDERTISSIIEHVDTLKQLAPELFFSKESDATFTPVPPRRTKSKSRESSPAVDKREGSLSPEEKQQQIHYVMQRIVKTTEELRQLQKMAEDEYERERIRRSMGMRRATSTEHDTNDLRYNKPYLRQKPIVTAPLHRKSLSLEHTMQNEQKIWKNDTDSMSSLQSLELNSDIEIVRGKRDTSLDSRLSGGSTQSDFGDKKKKKGFIGKLKKLTKSRSIDDQDPGTFSPTRSLSSRPNSNSDVIEERGSKKDLKERITGIFKKSGSSSRSNSMERQRHDTSSTQRPLMRNGSNGNITQPPVEAERPQKGKSKKS